MPIPVILTIAVLLLAGCQSAPPAPQSMSVEEAKKLTATFDDKAFTPPPRSIADITAILDEQKPDESYRAAVQVKLQAKPPVNATAASLAEFYSQRADVSMQAGLGAEALADARESVRFARAARDSAILERSLGHLIMTENYTGTDPTEAAQEELATAKLKGWIIMTLNSMTLASVRRGDLEAAKSWVAKSDAYFASYQQVQHPPYQIADVRANVSHAHFKLEEGTGRYSEAERSIRSSINDVRNWSAAAAGVPESIGQERTDYRLAGRMRDLTYVLIKQGRLAEAEATARESLNYNLRRTGRTSPPTANSIWALASALSAQGRFADAQRLSLAEIETRQALGIPVVDARNRLGDLLAVQRRWSDAIANFEDAYESIPRVMALYESEDVAAGLAMARRIFDRQSRMLGENDPQVLGARGFVATGLWLQGNDSAAREMFRATFAHGQPTDVPIFQEYQRYSTETYLRLLAGAARRTDEDWAEAFEVADALRVAGTDRAVSASVARARLSDPGLADLARREQDAQQQIAARQEILVSALSRPIERQDAATLTTLRSEIDQLKQARAVLTQEVEKRFPDYANLVNPPPASVEQTRAVLSDAEALVALYAGEKQSYVWALRKNGEVAFAVISLRREQLANMAAQLRRALDPQAASLGEIPPFDVTLAHELYATLLQPVEAGWKGARTLIVVPHGPLAQIPFSLLVTKPVPQAQDGATLFSGYRNVPFLAREVAVTQAPSVAALIILRGVPSASPARRPFVGFGDPWFSSDEAAQARAEPAVETRGFHLRAAPATEMLASANLAMLPRLPDTAAEVLEVAATLHADPSKDVFLGTAANEWQVRSMKLDDRRVVMFATHGLVPGDLDGLDQPALALSAPTVAGVPGDGLLTMDKILGLKLDADWVVLSACNTAAGSGAGAEAVSGLGRAFFYAGARALLVTHWPVETTSARQLTTQTFKLQAADSTLTRAEALRASMLSLIDSPGYVDPQSGKIVFSYAHPIFWAPFSLVGDGR